MISTSLPYTKSPPSLSLSLCVCFSFSVSLSPIQTYECHRLEKVETVQFSLLAEDITLKVKVKLVLKPEETVGL